MAGLASPLGWVRVNVLALRRHPACAAFLATVATVLAWDGLRREVVGRAALYVAAVGLAVLIIDSAVGRWPHPPAALPIRARGRELALLGGNAVGAFGFLWARFVSGFLPGSIGTRVLFFAGLGALFNVFLFPALLGLGYRPSEIGVRAKGVGASLLIVVLFGALTLTFAPDRIATSVRSVGTAPFLTVPLAGLSEEFFRFAWQTRLGAWRANAAFGWIAASGLWAVFHGPIFWAGTRSVFHASIGVVEILPIGLLLGYLSHRTKSFLPAALVHGTNIWGLHNLG
jgi:hypothetical protein